MPGRQLGHAHVVDLRHEEQLTSVMIPAHQHALAALVLSRTGALLASASEHGTLVRVFSVATREMLYELRRG